MIEHRTFIFLSWSIKRNADDLEIERLASRNDKSKAKQKVSRVKCVWRNSESGNDCSSVQQLDHPISILHFLRQNKNTTKCKAELHNSRWNEIVHWSEEELEEEGLNTSRWNSIDEDRRSANDDQRFDCWRRNECEHFHSWTDRRETNHRSARKNCSGWGNDRIDKSSNRKDSSREDELLNAEQMMMFDQVPPNEDWKDDDLRENHSSSKSHFVETLEIVERKDLEEWSFPPVDQQEFESGWNFLRHRLVTTTSIETSSASTVKIDRGKAIVPKWTKRKHEDREKSQKRRTRSEGLDVSLREMFKVGGSRRRALPTIRISFFGRDSLVTRSNDMKTDGLFIWKCCWTFKWIFNDWVTSKTNSFICLFTVEANCFCSKRFLVSRDEEKADWTSSFFSKSVS